MKGRSPDLDTNSKTRTAESNYAWNIREKEKEKFKNAKAQASLNEKTDNQARFLAAFLIIIGSTLFVTRGPT